MRSILDNPIASFGFSIEANIRPIRANIIAANEMINLSDAAEPDVFEALGFLIVDAYARLDRVLAEHAEALEMTKAFKQDPLLGLIERFSAAKAEVDKRAESETAFEAETFHAEHVQPLWRELCQASPPTSAAGAVAALRLALEEEATGPGRLEGVMIRSAIAFLEGRPA